MKRNQARLEAENQRRIYQEEFRKKNEALRDLEIQRRIKIEEDQIKK